MNNNNKTKQVYGSWLYCRFCDAMKYEMQVYRLLYAYQFAINQIPDIPHRKVSDFGGLFCILSNLSYYDKFFCICSIFSIRKLKKAAVEWLLFGDLHERILQTLELLPNNESRTTNTQKFIQTLIENGYSIGFDASYWRKISFCREHIATSINLLSSSSDAEERPDQIDTTVTDVSLFHKDMTATVNIISSPSGNEERPDQIDTTVSNVSGHIVVASTPSKTKRKRRVGRPAGFEKTDTLAIILKKYMADKTQTCIDQLTDYLVAEYCSCSDIHGYVLLTIALENNKLIPVIANGKVKSFVEIILHKLLPADKNLVYEEFNSHYKKMKNDEKLQDNPEIKQYTNKISEITKK